MNSKKWIRIWFIIIIIIIPIVGGFNYVVDPYGYFNRNNKYSSSLTRINKPNVLNTKLYTNSDIYLIGTSRVMRINPNMIENYTNNNVQNINISGATFKENAMIAKNVKLHKKNFIYGFDAFSLNEYRIKNYNDLQIRYKAYENEIKHNNIKEFVLIKSLLNIDLLAESFKDIVKRVFNKNIKSIEIEENLKIYDYNSTQIKKEVMGIKDDKGNYNNYISYSDDEIISLAECADKKDIFIIYPKNYYYYQLFQKYQGIEKKYFHAITLLVKNTKAKVWIFYGLNKITKNKDNFDTNGWHFKPKIAKQIFDDIYSNEPKIGYLLTNDNVDEYLNNMHNSISKTISSQSL